VGDGVKQGISSKKERSRHFVYSALAAGLIMNLCPVDELDDYFHDISSISLLVPDGKKCSEHIA
jgi:hypothetical protein